MWKDNRARRVSDMYGAKQRLFLPLERASENRERGGVVFLLGSEPGRNVKSSASKRSAANLKQTVTRNSNAEKKIFFCNFPACFHYLTQNNLLLWCWFEINYIHMFRIHILSLHPFLSPPPFPMVFLVGIICVLCIYLRTWDVMQWSDKEKGEGDGGCHLLLDFLSSTLPPNIQTGARTHTHTHARTPAGKLRPPRLATYWLLRATWKMFVLHRYVVETQLIFVLVRRHSSGEGWGGGRQWERGWEVEQTVQKGGMCVWGRVGWGGVRKGGKGLSGSLSKTSKGSERSCTCQVINDDATVCLTDCLSVGALWWMEFWFWFKSFTID